MTETTPRGTAATEEATQQLRVTGSRLPGSLDPASPSRPRDTRDETPSDTEVLSIHDLLDGAATEPALTPLPPEDVDAAPTAPAPAAVPAVAATPVATPTPPAPTPAAPTPAARPATAAAPEPRPRAEVADRVRADAAAAWTGARREVGEWLARGDNALIVATLGIALLLLVVVAAVA